jgi:hypothetical protein
MSRQIGQSLRLSSCPALGTGPVKLRSVLSQGARLKGKRYATRAATQVESTALSLAANTWYLIAAFLPPVSD